MSIFWIVNYCLISFIVGAYFISWFYQKFIVQKLIGSNNILKKSNDECLDLIKKQNELNKKINDEANYWYQVSQTLAQKLMQIDPTIVKKVIPVSKGELN